LLPLGIVWLVLMVGAFYMLLWRPQQRRIAMVRALQSEVQVGDEILTTSGIYARVRQLGEFDAEIEVAPGTVIRVARGAIGQVLNEPDASLDLHGEAGRDLHGEASRDAHGEATEAG
jgi:preprotein translocase subunit YajC